MAGFMPGANIVDSGLATLNGIPVGWMETLTKTNQVGIDIEMYSLTFGFTDGKRMVSLWCYSASTPESGDGAARKHLEDNAKLYQNMLNSVILISSN
jgi:hypothetical protein